MKKQKEKALVKFSVLIPVYNVETYLEECVNSVLRQTYKNFEIILVNDGSADKSAGICDRFYMQYPDKIKVIHKENEGVVLARNEAIRQAEGAIMVFLDADDCLRPDALMQMHDTFEKHLCDMVIYNYSKKPDFSVPCMDKPMEADKCMSAEEKTKLYTLLCNVSYLNALWIKAVKKELADLLLNHDEWRYVTNGEDLLCTLPMVTKAEKIVYLDQSLYYYRQRLGSTVQTFSFNRLRSNKILHKEFEKYIDLWQMPQMHPAHFAREVRGWIESMLMLLNNKDKMEYDKFQKGLSSMAEDEYFINAYLQMYAASLSVKHRVLAKWLYKRKFALLQAAGALRRIKLKLSGNY